MKSFLHIPILTSLLCGAVGALPAAAGVKYAGINLSGAEFGQSKLPGEYDEDYVYPGLEEVDYFLGKGMNIARLPFRWERLQPTMNGEFNATEMERMTAFVSGATAKGMHVILDPHNYARYYPEPADKYSTSPKGVVGSDVPNAALADLWRRLAEAFMDNDRVFFGLMNEPNAMPTEQWVAAANDAIAAIRETGAKNMIFVPGSAWSGAFTWAHDWYGTPNATAMQEIVDPGDNLVIEVHQYLDKDGSGTSPEIVSETIGAERLAGFTQWLKDNNRRGFLGEFAVAASTIGEGIGDEAVDNMLAHIEENTDVWLGWAWWAAGPWWGDYMFTLAPDGETDRPQMKVLEKHLGPVGRR